MEYKEVMIPKELTEKLDEASLSGAPITLGQAGVFDWLSKLSKDEGWRVVWQATMLPYFVLEREDRK